MKSKEFLDLITERRMITKQKLAYVEYHVQLGKTGKELLEDPHLLFLLEKEEELISKRNQLFEKLYTPKANE